MAAALARLLRGFIRLIADANAVWLVAGIVAPLAVWAGAAFSGFVQAHAQIIALVFSFLWPVTLLAFVLGVRRAVIYQRGRAEEMAEGLRPEALVLAPRLGIGDPSVDRVCLTAMVAVSESLRKACLKAIPDNAKKVCLIHFDLSGGVVGWPLLGYSRLEESKARMAKLTRRYGTAATALDQNTVVVVPDAENPPSSSGYVRLSNPPEHTGMMAAPVEALDAGMKLTGIGSLCLAWTAKGRVDVGDFDRLVLQEFAKKVGGICATARGIYCEHARLNECPIMARS